MKFFCFSGKIMKSNCLNKVLFEVKVNSWWRTLILDLPNFPKNGNVEKWKMNFMDFPEKVKTKFFFLKVSLFYFSLDIFDIFLRLKEYQIVSGNYLVSIKVWPKHDCAGLRIWYTLVWILFYSEYFFKRLIKKNGLVC